MLQASFVSLIVTEANSLTQNMRLRQGDAYVGATLDIHNPGHLRQHSDPCTWQQCSITVPEVSRSQEGNFQDTAWCHTRRLHCARHQRTSCIWGLMR